MNARYVRSFSEPDELVELGPVRSAVLSFAGLNVSYDVHQPGWRWSIDVKPVINTPSCQIRHIEAVLRGRLHVRLDDGTEFEVGPLDVVDIPAGHDAWVVGDEPFETIAWGGGKNWLAPPSLGERVLVTLLACDVVGSTGIAARLGDAAWSELLGDFQFRTRDLIGQYRGRVVDFAGDGVLAVFDGVARAVRCAVALLAMASGLGLILRMGVHTGEVELAEDSVRGVAVHEVSRIVAVAEPEEVLASEMTASLAADAGIAFEDHGEHELRGLAGARRLFRFRT